MKKLFCCPALEFFCCLPLWKTVLLSSSRAFLLSTPMENSAVCQPLCKTVRLHGKKLQNATNCVLCNFVLSKKILGHCAS